MAEAYQVGGSPKEPGARYGARVITERRLEGIAIEVQTRGGRARSLSGERRERWGRS